MTNKNLQRDTLRKLQLTNKNKLIPLRIEYSEKSKLLTGYVNKLINQRRIYPSHLPTQASFRWSTSNPPLTNFPRACINPDHLLLNTDIGEHEWIDDCWSLRDCIQCDDDEVMVSWDHDNIEGKIHDLVVEDEENIVAHRDNYDLHTLMCCRLFNMELPKNLRNPHTSLDDVDWRAKYQWQGKDTKRRVLTKNFNHGSKYSPTWRFVYNIKGIERYGIDKKALEALAKEYIKSKQEPWDRKLEIMKRITKERIARSLYGGRRMFFESSFETGKEGFSHMVSGTVSDYNNETLILLEERYKNGVRLLHNAHDGNKVAFKKDVNVKKEDLIPIIERPILYNGRSLIMTAGVKIHG